MEILSATLPSGQYATDCQIPSNYETCNMQVTVTSRSTRNRADLKIVLNADLKAPLRTYKLREFSSGTLAVKARSMIS